MELKSAAPNFNIGGAGAAAFGTGRSMDLSKSGVDPPLLTSGGLMGFEGTVDASFAWS